MKRIYVRPINGANNAELQQFKDAYASSNGELGPEVTYPETAILVAENGEPILFMPVQSCYVMGSLGYGEATELQLSNALRQLTQVLIWESRKQGRGDIYFVGGHPESDRFAGNNDFELVDKPVYRLRLKQ